MRQRWLGEIETLREEVAAWSTDVNDPQGGVDWHMKVEIPETLASQQIKFGIEAMTQAEYCQALRQKLIEEAQEAAEAGETNLVTELADLYEVIEATMGAYGIKRNQVLACQMQRRSTEECQPAENLLR